MKKFILNCVSFVLPLIIVLGLFLLYAEMSLQNYPSTFQTKAKYYQSNKDQIEILVLGSSHNQNAINPALIENFNVANLSFGGQTLAVDYLLLKKLLPQLTNLKAVIIELSYITLEHEQPSTYHRNSLYLRFYGLNTFGRSLTPIDYSIYFSNPKLYNEFLNPFDEGPRLNKYGFRLVPAKTESALRFESMQYDTSKILADTNSKFILRAKYEDLAAFERNKALFEEMISKCLENKIIPIVISPPVYKSYFKSYLKNKELRRLKFISEVQEKYPALYFFRFDNHKAFDVTDFKNEDHLNIKGAGKFSKLLSLELNSILSDN